MLIFVFICLMYRSLSLSFLNIYLHLYLYRHIYLYRGYLFEHPYFIFNLYPYLHLCLYV